MCSKHIDIPQHLIIGAALLGLGVFFIDINRRTFLKAFDILGVPPPRLVWENQTEDDEENEEEEEEEAECKQDEVR